jgi:hypothetical protein
MQRLSKSFDAAHQLQNCEFELQLIVVRRRSNGEFHRLLATSQLARSQVLFDKRFRRMRLRRRKDRCQ